jgi:NitT/TauT family transport system substrate-binding protein
MACKRWTTIVASVAAASLLAACSGAASSDESAGAGEGDGALTPVTVGTTPIVNAGTLYLGIEQGFFEDEGLDVTPQVIQAAATAIPSMLNGELNFALVSAIPTITAHSRGIPVAAVMGNEVYPESSEGDPNAVLVAADSPINSAADLGGTTIAVVGLKSAPELATRVALRDAGVDLTTVEFVEIPFPDMASAVQNGRVDAAMVGDPFLDQGLAQGLKAVSHPFSEAFAGMTGLMWISVRPYLEANTETAEAFTRAMERSVQYAVEHPDEVRAIAAEFTPLPPEALEAVRLPPFHPDLDEADIAELAEVMATEGFLEKEPDLTGLVWRP